MSDRSYRHQRYPPNLWTVPPSPTPSARAAFPTACSVGLFDMRVAKDEIPVAGFVGPGYGISTEASVKAAILFAAY